ncbi:MAG TPA: carboxypeptidase-like regulatory domain-containing protein [Anaerolineae bacterium]|nr:carboxypeptidase-like regulatory domain-containing protein [Anaerolineae bacterium]
MKVTTKKWFWLSVPVAFLLVLVMGPLQLWAAVNPGGMGEGAVSLLVKEGEGEGTAVVFGNISGTVFAPDGVTPVANSSIEIEAVGGGFFDWTTTSIDGTYSFVDLEAGEYHITAFPPDNAFEWAGSWPESVTVVEGQTVTQNLHLTMVQLSGFVQDDRTGLGIAGASVVVFDENYEYVAWGSSSAEGYFRIGAVMTGTTYILEAFAPAGSDYVLVAPVVTTPPDANITINMTIPQPNVEGRVLDNNQLPVRNASVFIYNSDYGDEVRTNLLGNFSIAGLEPGEYWLEVDPPWGRGDLLPSDPISITITDPTTYILVGDIVLAAASKAVTGQVTYLSLGSTVLVDDAIVWASRLDDAGYYEVETSVNGEYLLNLSGGEWEIGIEPANYPPLWMYEGDSVVVEFALDDTPEAEIVNFEATATDAGILGQITCPNGPCSALPPGALWVSLENEDMGVGTGSPVGQDYSFNLSVVSGWYELSVHVDTNLLQAPPPISIYAEQGQTLNVGEIQLVARDSSISGRVTNPSGVGKPGINLFAWQDETGYWSWTETDGAGNYTLAVTGGEWFVLAEAPITSTYIVVDRVQHVSVPSLGNVADVNFTVVAADSQINGFTVDAQSGAFLSQLTGWAWSEAWVNDDYRYLSDGPVDNGQFELGVVGGTNYRVGVYVPPQSAYMPAYSDPFPVGPAQMVSMTVPLQRKNAMVQGQLRNGITGEPILGVSGEVFAYSQQLDAWTATNIDPETGYYEMALAAGDWWLEAWVNPETGYVTSDEGVMVTAVADGVVEQHIPAWNRNATIRGQVTNPAGEPISGAYVFATGSALQLGEYETFVRTGFDGRYELRVPTGVYKVGSALPRQVLMENGWLTPPIQNQIGTGPNNPATGIDFQFQEVDAYITGQVTFEDAEFNPDGRAFVWAWAESGEWAMGRVSFSSSGVATYTLNVRSGTVWYVGGVYEDWDNEAFYEAERQAVAVAEAGTVEQDLLLSGPYPFPEPVVMSFDATKAQTIEMDNGAVIRIPAGALASQGRVTMYFFPTRDIRPSAGQELVGFGYEIRATDNRGREITQFNKDVVISFPYDEGTIGGDENDLVVGYYSTLLERWVVVDNVVVNPDANRITFRVDHFSLFGTLLVPEGGIAYIPAVFIP